MNIDTDLLYDDKESERRRRERKRRREERRKRSTEKKKSLSFLWGVRELSPVILSMQAGDGYVSYSEIAKTVRNQEEILDVILDSVSDDSSNTELFQLRAGIASSRIISGVSKADVGNIVDCINMISRNNDRKSDLIEQIEIGVFSSDVLVNIKMQILPSLYEFYSSLKTLTTDDNIIQEYVSWLNNVATELAKDVSFNWDKKSTYRDRETLFLSMLPICADMAVSAFFEYLSKYNGVSRVLSSSSSVEIMFPLLHSAVQDLDMGHRDHKDKNMSWLLSQLSTIMIEKIPYVTIPNNHQMYYNRIMGSILSDIDSIAAECWKKESESFMSKIEKEISSLSDDEAESLMMEKYADPMPISGFISSVSINIDRWPGIINPIDIDLSMVSGMAEKKMSILWGLTDAVCQIRSTKK